MSDLEPIRMLIPEERFLSELITFVQHRCHVPEDGKWRNIKLEFEIKCDPEFPNASHGGGFLLGGSGAN